MKKKMLIVGITMAAAGSEKSFLSFAGSLDYDKYEVDLLLAKKTGDFSPTGPSSGAKLTPKIPLSPQNIDISPGKSWFLAHILWEKSVVIHFFHVVFNIQHRI